MTLDLEAIEKRLTERFGASNDGTWRDIAPLIAEVRRLREALEVVNEQVAPVRLCCAQRHYGAQCPDGLVMCQLCFHRFPVEALNVTDGVPEDVCKGCAWAEAARGPTDE